MTIALPALPYDYHALEPVISSATMKLHHGAHHRGYVEKLNALIQGSELEGEPLEEIVRRARGAVFNNAAQAWNHAFFWKSLWPKPANPPPRSALAARFSDALQSAAAGLFGSGWVWLVEDAGVLKIVTTSNADTPIAHGQRPLLVIDLWEHGYYLDHHNRRDLYVTGVIDHLLDWQFAERNVLRAMQGEMQ
jgi:Fe-Mn family superoxide dismutase